MENDKAAYARLVGKVVATFEEVSDIYNCKFRITFTDGSRIDFHGGAVGYENANPWFDYESDARDEAHERAQ